MLDRARAAILSADPGIVETVKWGKRTGPEGVTVLQKNGIICSAETYKTHVKLTFMHGAALADPESLFNAPFTGATRRAIDFREGDKVDAKALKALVKAAVMLGEAKGGASKKAAKKEMAPTPRSLPASPPPPLPHRP